MFAAVQQRAKQVTTDIQNARCHNLSLHGHGEHCVKKSEMKEEL